MTRIRVKSKGDWKKTEKFLQFANKNRINEILNYYGSMGVEALRNATPVRSGLTRDSWGYKVEITQGKYSIIWTNSNVQNDWANVAILIQYGHATGTGGFVRGIDYINPALKPVFDEILTKVWEEVRDA